MGFNLGFKGLMFRTHKKVKESQYKPGQALRVPGA